MVYSQLAVSTVGGTSYRIIKKYEDNNNGYGAWKALFDLYDGNAVKNKTADYLKSKLGIYYLTSTSNAAQYINNFSTSFR